MSVEAREYLEQVELYDVNIKNMLEESRQLRASILSATSNLTADTVIPGSTNDKIGDTVAKIVDLEREVNETIDKYVDLKKRVLRTIAKVEDPAELRLLYLRYFRYMSWEQIACEMGYSYRNVCYIHSNALQSVEKIREGKWRDKKRKPE